MPRAIKPAAEIPPVIVADIKTSADMPPVIFTDRTAVDMPVTVQK